MKYFYFLFTLFSFISAQTFQSVIQRLEQSPIEQRQKIIEQYLNSKGVSPIIEQDTLLHFVLYGEAKSVSVIGDLQHWNEPAPLEQIQCGTYSLFYRTFVVSSDARLDYQLIIDGKYMTDPQNPSITPSGFGPHSEVRMPKFISSTYLQYSYNIAHGTIDSLAPARNIPPPLNHYLVSIRPIKVYTPAGYDTLKNLPSIYIHDGFEAIDYSRIPIVLDNLITDRKIPPIIAVFIPPVNRGSEHFGMLKDQFVKYLADDLVPLIDHVYRTAPSAEFRAMTGISSGGYISLYTVINRPDIFQNVGGQSSLITPLLMDLTKKQFASGKILPQIKIYLDCGHYDLKDPNPSDDTNDLLQQNRRYSELLSTLRIPHYYKELNDGHEWANWRERTPEMLIYFFGKH